MLAMQYIFTFPEDYDMTTIRARVMERGAQFDKLEGLFEKAFLISEKGKGAVQQNTYAPFYIWNYPQAMTAFIASDKFSALTQAFGRPTIKSWIPVYFSTGLAKTATPLLATKETVSVPADAEFAEVRRIEYAQHRRWTELPNHHSSYIGLDPATWEIIRFALWTALPDALPVDAQIYQVLHLSAPALDFSAYKSIC